MASASAVKTRQSRRADAGVRVLLVSECTMTREGIRRVVEDSPGMHVVAEACSLDAAIRIGRSEAPDIVLLDIMPPYVSYLDGPQKLQRQVPGVRLVALVAEADIILPRCMGNSEVGGFLTKHCSAEELAIAIQSVHGGRQYVSEDLARHLAMSRFHDEGGSPFDDLSQRELQIMLLVTQGRGTEAIAEYLNLAPKTVNTYRQRLLGKLGVRTDVALTHLALRHGVIEPDGSA